MYFQYQTIVQIYKLCAEVFFDFIQHGNLYKIFYIEYNSLVHYSSDNYFLLVVTGV